jgi:membrane protein DedA with SNARE-associated domain
MPEFFQTIQNSLPELSTAGLLFLFFFGTFVSEDAACLLAGTAAASGRIGFAAAVTSCFLGIFAGDVLLYGVGRLLGSRFFENRFVKRFVSEHATSKASAWLKDNAAAAVFTSRFVTGLRLPTYLAAGALRTDFTKFAAYFLLASAVWTPLLVGSTAFSQTFLFPKNAILGLVVIAVAVRLILKFSSRRNRRFFVGRLKRIVKWEFWPIHVFYVPVVLYVLFLAVKHRSLTSFTAVNPVIPAGGFKGESKNDIYCGLRQTAAPHMLDHVLLRCNEPISERLKKARGFIDEHGLNFPLVLKPDAGERGKDVAIIRSHDELEKGLLSTMTDTILQEFIAGDEISIFYYRYPTEERGKIFSITEKRFPIVTGDGSSTLEELILDDPRAVCLAEKYFEQNRDRMASVPASGEPVKMIDIGTHSRGAIFLDGGWIKTAALEQRIDAICRGFDGFYFGRFDIRSPSLSYLRCGKNFKIIELNGVTSESTNIYDPRHSLIDAYRILFCQWRIAFEIGTENIKLGASPTSILDLVKLTFGVDLTRNNSAIACKGPVFTDN